MMAQAKRIKFENEILDETVRARVLTEIESTENQMRKYNSYKRYLCYKDQTSRFVVENLLRQLRMQTVVEMRYSIANISLVKKIIDKLARVYSNGVTRTVTDNEDATKMVEDLAKELDLNTAMKKVNRFLKLHKNCALYLKPCPEYNSDGSQVCWDVEPTVLCPHHYDVIEGYFNRTEALVFILSDYNPVIQNFSSLDPGIRPLSPTLQPKGDGQDQTIADTPEDEGRDPLGEKKYIWWSENYHFTTDKRGRIIPDDGNPQNVNPFGKHMIHNFASDQDGSFWAEGGDDLIDGAILINSMITHLNNIGVLQSYGQFYMSGENLPGVVEVGPNKVIKMEYKKDEQAEPKLGFLNASPQLDSLRGCIEAYVALLLTTNNLSTNGVSAQLGGSRDLASGVALVVDKAESLEDVQDQRQIFLDEEPEIFSTLKTFLDVYRAQLCEDLVDFVLPDNLEDDLTLKFNDQSPIMSEKEKLEVYKLREELGLDNLLSLLMKDDPSLTKQQAEKKLKDLIAERMMVMKAEDEARAAAGLAPVPDPATAGANPQGDNPDNPNSMQNGNPDNPNPGAPGENSKSGGLGS